ncbi:hypothetical protein [Streptomyces sp. NPDC096323]|uniref:hypothetical protein n=1 Tax=Streptomyces sp. NPDC096323 TaxID=3155822 RepID=UPI003323428B
MRQIDLPLQIDRLRDLGADFTALQVTVEALNPQPGSDLLKEVGQQILSIHQLVGRALIRLSVLDGSQYTAVPGSLFSLAAFSKVIASASTAASQLASAVSENPLEGAVFVGGPPPEVESIRQTRHAEAAPVLKAALASAARHLSLSATCCFNAASGITSDVTECPEHRPELPQLKLAQYTALELIAQGGALRYVGRKGAARVQGGDGKAIRPAPFAVLEEHHLVRVAATTGYVGQDVTVSAAGRLALAFQKPPVSQPTVPGAAPKPSNTARRLR